MSNDVFLLIHFDGYSLGLKDAFNETYLDFDEEGDALDTLRWWTAWVKGADI